MRYLKSLLAGFLTLLLGVFVMLIAAIVYFAVASSGMPEGTAIGWDPISLVRQSVISWIVFLILFVIGFAWRFRKTQ